MSNSKKKGARAELKAAAVLSSWTGVKFNRTPASGALRWGRDVRVSGDVVAPVDFFFPFSVEVKVRKKMPRIAVGKPPARQYVAFWLQATKDAVRVGKQPLVMCREDYTPSDKWTLLATDVFWRDVLVPLGVDCSVGVLMAASDDVVFFAFDSDFLFSRPYCEVVAMMRLKRLI